MFKKFLIGLFLLLLLLIAHLSYGQGNVCIVNAATKVGLDV
ncbi:hypothetical protein [Candidatus Coxiella mudrowiae]|nr:hypothetical protein [Candidatus Coxiella mudrowiae]